MARGRDGSGVGRELMAMQARLCGRIDAAQATMESRLGSRIEAEVGRLRVLVESVREDIVRLAEDVARQNDRSERLDRRIAVLERGEPQ